MVVELRQALHAPRLQSWPQENTLNPSDRPGISSEDLSLGDLAKVPRCAASDPVLALLRLRSESLESTDQDSSEQASQNSDTEDGSEDALSTGATGLQDPLDISLKPLLDALPDVKRRRYPSDVDGINTAGNSYKKRRLRAQLITSRLSQPFSQPATHILNREGQESGDKRFLKMATSVDLNKRLAHLHSTSFLRYSVMNSVRKRLGVKQREEVAARSQEDDRVGAEVNTTAPWKPKPYEVGNAIPSIDTASEASTRPPSPFPKTHGCRLSNPAALPLPASDVAATMNRTLLRIDPIQSPEQRSPEPGEASEEDSFAFLHPETDDDWDELGDDDPEHVYSDFGVIFGGGGGGSSDADPQEEHSYEEYLDELDGISWVTR